MKSEKHKEKTEWTFPYGLLSGFVSFIYHLFFSNATNDDIVFRMVFYPGFLGLLLGAVSNLAFWYATRKTFRSELAENESRDMLIELARKNNQKFYSSAIYRTIQPFAVFSAGYIAASSVCGLYFLR